MGIIYCWTNKITKKKYIGQTIHPEQRKRNHIHEAFIKGSDYYFHRSLRKHGLESFEYEVLEENIENLDDRENHYIDLYNTIWPNGYNQQYAKSLSLSAINKMSETKKKQWKEMSDKEKEKRREYLIKIATGKKQTENQKKIARESNQKEWLVTFPDGHTETIVNLQKFCIDQGLGTNGQSNLTRGSYKGYKAIKK